MFYSANKTKELGPGYSLSESFEGLLQVPKGDMESRQDTAKWPASQTCQSITANKGKQQGLE